MRPNNRIETLKAVTAAPTMSSTPAERLRIFRGPGVGPGVRSGTVVSGGLGGWGSARRPPGPSEPGRMSTSVTDCTRSRAGHDGGGREVDGERHDEQRQTGGEEGRQPERGRVAVSDLDE